MSSFKDHFSGIAADYGGYRPGYPDELFAWLAEIAPSRRLAWDCATGTGQAAVGLAAHFERVAAIDAAASQVEGAERCGNIDYRIAPAEASGLEAGSSALRRDREAGFDPLVALAPKLIEAWGEGERWVSWPLAPRVGVKKSAQGV